MTTIYSLAFLILGFHVIHYVLAGMIVKQVTLPMQSMSTTNELPKGENTPEPSYLHHHFLQRRVDTRRRLPRKKHLRPTRLLRRMGRDFDTFWMSQHLPHDFSTLLTKRNVDSSLRAETEKSSLNLHKLANELYNTREEIESFSQTSNDTSININTTTNVIQQAQAITKMVDGLQSWLIQVASCPVYYKWKDFGLTYWPRWVRTGSCSLPVDKNPLKESFLSQLSNDSSTFPPQPLTSPPSCSWPSGMRCSPGKEKRLRLLKWNCRYWRMSEDLDKSRRTGKKSRGSTHNTTSHDFTKNDLDSHHYFDHDHHDDHFDHHDDHDDHFDHHDDDESHEGDDIAAMNEQFRGLFTKLTELDDSNDKKSRNTKFHKTREQREKGDDQERDLEDDTTAKTTRQSRQLARSLGTRTTSRRTRRASGAGHKAGDRHHGRHHHHGKGNRRGKKRRSGMRCRWEKITHPVVNDCYCTC